jgi:hypothetical protein
MIPTVMSKAKGVVDSEVVVAVSKIVPSATPETELIIDILPSLGPATLQRWVNMASGITSIYSGIATCCEITQTRSECRLVLSGKMRGNEM